MTESITYSVYTAIFTTLIPSSILLGLRFYARKIKHVKLWWDDYLAVLAMAAAIAYDAAAFFLITKGLGLHVDNLPVPIAEASYYQLLIMQVHEHAYTVGITAAQLSLLSLFWRIFSSVTCARLFIFILTGCVSIWCIVRVFIAIFQCYPPEYLWDKTIEGHCRIDPAKYFLGSVSAHLVIDLALMVLPATQISRLLLPWPQKTAIAAMFMFGIVVVIASVMMLVAASKYNSNATDFMWNCTPALFWSAVEINLSVIACCLPVMRPVVHALGGWWGQNFSSRKEVSAPSFNHVKLGHVHRSTGAMDGGESTYNLASTADSNQTEATADSGRIYGQGQGSDTIISTGKAKEKLEPSMPTSSKDGAILVQYEVDLSFSRHDTQGR